MDRPISGYTTVQNVYCLYILCHYMHQKQIYLILQFLDTPPEHVNGMIGISLSLVGGIFAWEGSHSMKRNVVGQNNISVFTVQFLKRLSFILDLNRGLSSVLHVACVLNSKVHEVV